MKRLDAFTKTTDGFSLAEIDFELRGPGDLFGTCQHGLPAKTPSSSSSPTTTCKTPAYERLKRQVLKRYGAALELGDVG